MLQAVNNFLKNAGCSYCQENDYSDKKENYQNWKLCIKENEMFSALILYNDSLKKDISYLSQKESSIDVIDQKNNKIILKLDYISNFEDNNFAILVPDEKYEKIYEELIKKEKKLIKELNSYYIDTYNIKIN